MNGFQRQIDILAPEDLETLHVDLVGAGALGGAILLVLTKMGVGIRNRVTVTDFDRCEAMNIATQWFRPADAMLNRSKVDALAELVSWFGDREVTPVQERFTGSEERPIGPIVVVAVDTLAERRALWKNLRERTDLRLLVDARLGGEVAEILTLSRGGDHRGADDPEAYEESLEGEAFPEPCTRRAIAYASVGAAACVGSVVRAWARGEPFPRRVSIDFRNLWIDRSG